MAGIVKDIYGERFPLYRARKYNRVVDLYEIQRGQVIDVCYASKLQVFALNMERNSMIDLIEDLSEELKKHDRIGFDMIWGKRRAFVRPLFQKKEHAW